MAEKQTKTDNSMIKFVDIKAMFESGMMGISSRTLDIAHSYKVVQFKTKLKNAYDEFNTLREKALAEAGIEDGNKFSAKFNELKEKNERSDADEKLFKELKEKNERFNGLFENLLNEPCKIEPKTMPYDQWRALLEENKNIKNGNFEMLAQFETILCGILWAAPEE